MATSNYTPNLHLNAWEETDRPKRADFVSDNQIIDTQLALDTPHTSQQLLPLVQNIIQTTSNFFGASFSAQLISICREFLKLKLAHLLHAISQFLCNHKLPPTLSLTSYVDTTTYENDKEYD